MIWSTIISLFKCSDGVCRTQCLIQSSACPSHKPIRCSEGKCVALMELCVSPRCSSDEPFLCPDGTCKDHMAKCRYPLNIRIIKKGIVHNENGTQAYNLVDQSNRLTGILYVESPLAVKYGGISISRVDKTKLSIDARYSQVFAAYFSKNIEAQEAREFIRSAIIKIDIDEKLAFPPESSPLKLYLRTDTMISHTSYDNYNFKVY